MNDYVIKGGYHRYSEITFLRGFAITTIVLMHLSLYLSLPSIVEKIALLGGSGVHVFFLCSAFGLYLSYINRETSYEAFLKKRLLKIYIPYAVVIIIYFLAPFVSCDGSRIIALLSHLFLFKMFVPRLENSLGMHWWFISTLFQFYFVFVPLCHFKKRVENKTFFITCMVISISWWIFTVLTGLNSIRVWGSFFLQYLWEFALGMIIAEWLFKNNEVKIPLVIVVITAITGLTLEGILGMAGGELRAFNDIPALFGYCCLGLLFYKCPHIKKMGAVAGKISYEWYLIHILVFDVVFAFGGNLVFAIIAFLSSIIIAVCLHWLFRKMRLV